METRLATRQVRLSQWSQIIKDRNQSGLTVSEYCKLHELSANSYYYWLRKVRESIIEANSIQFAEITCKDTDISDNRTSPVIIETGGMRINVVSPESRDTLAMVLEVISHA